MAKITVELTDKEKVDLRKEENELMNMIDRICGSSVGREMKSRGWRYRS